MCTRFGWLMVMMVAFAAIAIASGPASGQLLSSFEHDLSSTTGGTWGGDGTAAPSYVATGATDGASALAIHHPTGWSIQAFLKTGMPLAQLASQSDFLLIDVTTTDLGVAGDGWSPGWRQVIPVFNSNQGGWQSVDINVPVAADDGGSHTETVIFDLAATGIKANAAAFVAAGTVPMSYWELFLAMQGQDQGTVVKKGDYAGTDNIVNAADYTAWRDQLNGTTLANETVTPGIVDAADYDEWKSNFGNDYSRVTTIIDNIRFVNAGSGSLAGSAAPEPSSALLAMLAAVVVAVGRRVRK